MLTQEQEDRALDIIFDKLSDLAANGEIEDEFAEHLVCHVDEALSYLYNVHGVDVLSLHGVS